MKRLKILWKKYFWVLIVGILFGILSLFHIGCPIRAITGIPCAGCGMTRAYMALFRLDIRAAFYYHPLFWLVPIALYFIFAQKGPLARKMVKRIALILIIAAFLIVYILRLFFIRNSAIYLAGCLLG